VGAPFTGRPAAAGPATAQAGAAAATVTAAAARTGGDATGAAQAASLAARLERLAAEDVEAYAVALAALPAAESPEPQEPAEPDARRDFALGTALDHAAAVPLAIAEACADVVVLARSLAERLDPALAADLEAAALLAAGAARGAAHLVEVNLVVGTDDERAVRARAAAALE
jgi:methenyltetrahydrofolate cyclohydrolase